MKSEEEEMLDQPGAIQMAYRSISLRHQQMLDRATPHGYIRWGIVYVLATMFALRIYFAKGYYIVAYALGIYLLNLFIAFLTPKIDPALEDFEMDGPSLPTKVNEEFRPFMRRLPEFKFWYSTMKAFSVALICTCIKAFDVPVFWPILVMYFFVLFFVTMKKQILHMIKYKYLPFTSGKTKYKGKEDSGPVLTNR